MPTYNLYMGCSVPANYPNYEAATLKVAEALGMELIYMDGVGCCGSPNLRAIDYFGWLVVNARTLAIAEKNGHDIVTPCNGCFGSLKDVLYHLKHDKEDMKKVNDELKKYGLELKGNVRVRHVVEAMYTDIGIEAIKAKVTRPLDGVKIAVHYGCHILRPKDVTEINPENLDDLLRATGATVVEYPLWKQCCGATVLPVNEELAIRLAHDKLKSMKEAGAEFAMVICPACGNQLDLQQFGIKDTYGVEFNLPVLFYPQILALAMGMSEDEVGLEMNRVPADPILSHFVE
ncbi:MAG: CoB--CoM heterodisulfide reductase iron-sulfur subunit B family protein [Candidatus Thorarchaeota archaeon]|nr:CoB--CoM heterodisulfide reductase iron-sulfur subunit B family protein [Candidatus Thorarchaeota archaeon]